MNWTVYILQCADGTLYTGITNDLAARISAHEAGTGAKYTRGRGPLKLVFREVARDRASASRREIEIKALSRRAKEQLIKKPMK
ncbi:MAG: GIY-YIG nuclease family protein [Alphaproteobacteria bacterium]|jgi:putative endonuclease